MRLKNILISLSSGLLALGLFSGCENDSNNKSSHQHSTQSSQVSSNIKSTQQHKQLSEYQQEIQDYKHIRVPNLTYQAVNNLKAEINATKSGDGAPGGDSVSYVGVYSSPSAAYKGFKSNTENIISSSKDSKKQVVGSIGKISLFDHNMPKLPSINILGKYKQGAKVVVYKGAYNNKIIYISGNDVEILKNGAKTLW